MRFATGVITAPRSTSYLGATLASLAVAGFLRPLVFADAAHGDYDESGHRRPVESTPLEFRIAANGETPNAADVQIVPSPRRLGPYRNWKRALAALVEREPAADAFALFQDDILAARGLSGWLDANLWPADPGRIGVVSLYTAAPHHRRAAGWHRLPLTVGRSGGVPPYTRAYGALAYLFPPHSARRMLENDPRPENRTKIDMNVGEFCQQHRLDYWMHSPSLVQHTGAVSTLSDFGLTEHRRAREFVTDVAGLDSVAAGPPVTAVLLNWRRPASFERILPSLLAHDFIGEVLIWNNSGVPLDVSTVLDHDRSSRVRVIESPNNVCTYGRFCAIREAAHEIIFTQDDDCLIHNVRELYERFLSHRSSITAGLSPSHYRAEANRAAWLQLGWGSFFLRSWVGVLDRWTEHYGHDELLYRKADRIFTILFGKHDPQPGEFESLPGPDGRPSDRDTHALWLKADHSRLTALAAERALRLKCRLTQHRRIVGE